MGEIKSFEPGEPSWQNNREVIQEIPFPEFWTLELAQKWANEIPKGIESEGYESPLIEVDLTQEGYGKVFIKNEADRSINPTGTMKDRMGRSVAYIYKCEAGWALEGISNDPNYAKRFPEIRFPRFSMLTAGNAGMALANTFKNLDLPPPKLLLDKHTNSNTIEKLKKSRADIYLVDLSNNPLTGLPSDKSPLTAEQILLLTNNKFGKDLTSSNSDSDYSEPFVTYYQKLAEQILHERPNEIYVPYGSGALFGEVLLSQGLTASAVWDTKIVDPEMKQTINHAPSVKIFGAEPAEVNSIADKLSAPAKPFPTTWEKDLPYSKNGGLTDPDSGIVKLSEEEIKKGFLLLKKVGPKYNIDTEPSASAGLALYMKRWSEGKIKKDSKIIVINTGRGIISDTEK